MSDKKRKHAEDSRERPRKKKQVESASQPSIVKFSVLKDVGDWAPAIVSTPGLLLPTSIPLKPYIRPCPKTHHSLTPISRTPLSETELLLHSSAHPKLDYIAREENSGEADSLRTHYVGVYDPKTGELQVVQARKATVRVTLQSSRLQDDDDSGEEKAPQSRFAARTALGEAFGTKKSLKALRSLTENAIATPLKPSSSGKPVLDPLASAVLETVAEGSSSMPTREELQAEADEAKPRPKANLEATSPVDVYNLEDLVGMDALRNLNVREWQHTVKAKKEVQTTSRFVSRRLMTVVESEDVKRLKAMRFVLLMLNWFDCLKTSPRGGKKVPEREIVKKAVGDDMLDSLFEGLRRRFAPDGTMNKWAIDNFMTHIAAIALIIDRFEIDIADLRDDLKLETRQMSQYFHEIGCRVSLPTEAERTRLKIDKKDIISHKIAKLKIPLDFPKTRTPGISRRK